MNQILDERAPLKRINKYKLKFKSKPWIIPAIQKSIKKQFFKKVQNEKDSQIKETFHRQHKDYRNMISTLLKKAKQIIPINISKPI